MGLSAGNLVVGTNYCLYESLDYSLNQFIKKIIIYSLLFIFYSTTLQLAFYKIKKGPFTQNAFLYFTATFPLLFVCKHSLGVGEKNYTSMDAS